MRKPLQILSAIILIALCITTSCKKDSNDEEIIIPSKYYGWAVGGVFQNFSTIVHTKDGGQNWIRQGTANQLPAAGLSDVCILDKDNILIVGAPANNTYTVYKSADGGENWSQAGNKGLNNVDYTGAFALDNKNVWVVGAEGTVCYSADGAGSWTQWAVPVEYQNDLFLRVAARSTQDVWVVGDQHVNDSFPIMLHTIDGGVNWNRLNPIQDLDINLENEGGHFLSIKILGNSIWAVGGYGNFVVKSADNGAVWQNVTAPQAGGDANDIFLISETEAYLAEDYGGFFHTIDGGQNWIKKTTGTGNWLTGIAVLDNKYIWTCGSPGGANDTVVINYSTNKGDTWVNQAPDFIKDNFNGLYKIRFIEVKE